MAVSIPVGSSLTRFKIALGSGTTCVAYISQSCQFLTPSSYFGQTLINAVNSGSVPVSRIDVSILSRARCFKQSSCAVEHGHSYFGRMVRNHLAFCQRADVDALYRYLTGQDSGFPASALQYSLLL